MNIKLDQIAENCSKQEAELIEEYSKLIDDLNWSWEETLRQIEKIMRGEE